MRSKCALEGGEQRLASESHGCSLRSAGIFQTKRQSPLLLRVLLSLLPAGEQAWRGRDVPGAGDRAAGPVHRAVLGGRGG